jgi:hypothetical protein
MVGKRFAVGFVAFLILAQSALGQTAYKPRFKGDPARSNAEASALGYMRTVIDAQKVFKKRHTKYATSLPALINTGSFTRRMAKTDRGDYTVTFKAPSTQHYSIQLTPKVFDTDHRSFYVEENGAIKTETDKPASADSPALKPEE